MEPPGVFVCVLWAWAGLSGDYYLWEFDSFAWRRIYVTPRNENYAQTRRSLQEDRATESGRDFRGLRKAPAGADKRTFTIIYVRRRRRRGHAWSSGASRRAHWCSCRSRFYVCAFKSASLWILSRTQSNAKGGWSFFKMVPPAPETQRWAFGRLKVNKGFEMCGDFLYSSVRR